MKLKSAELIFKKILYFILRFFFRNEAANLPLNQKFNNILLLRNDRLGDMIVTIPLIRSIKKSFPDCRLDIIASDRNGFILEAETYIDNIFILKEGAISFISLASKLRKNKYDAVFCLVSSKTTNSGIFANLAAGTNAIKIIQGHDKRNALYSVLFNALIKQERNRIRMAEMMLKQADLVFGGNFKSDLSDYSLKIDKVSEDKANEFINKKGLSDYIFLNISAGSKIKCLSEEQNSAIITYFKNLNKDVVIFHTAEDNQKAKKLNEKFDNTILLQPENNLLSAALVKYSSFVVTSDTAVVHLAASFDKNALAVYTLKNGPIEEWLPLSDKIRIITTKGDESAENIDIDLILNELQSTFEGIRK